MSQVRVPFLDLTHRFSPFRDEFHEALDRIIDHSQFILGKEVDTFEKNLASFVEIKHAIGVANGTDALVLALKATGVGIGDEVITPPVSYLASTSCIALVGATPVFADIDYDINISPKAVERAISEKTKAIIAVHWGGNPAAIDQLKAIAESHSLILIEDCAQAIGAQFDNTTVGKFGDLAAMSLHPLKNLGAIGDAGVIYTDNDEYAQWLRLARTHGHSSRNQCEFWSENSRIDALQAAFLNAILQKLPERLQLRRGQAFKYREQLADFVTLPDMHPNVNHSYNTFAIFSSKRDELQAYLDEKGVETKIHYPIPIHRLNACEGKEYKSFGTSGNELAVTEQITSSMLSIPIGAHLDDSQIDFVIEAFQGFGESRISRV